MAAKEREVPDWLIGALVVAGAFPGMWLGYRWAWQTDGSPLLSVAGLLGGAIVGGIVTFACVVIIPAVPLLFRLANALLWAVVMGAIGGINAPLHILANWLFQARVRLSALVLPPDRQPDAASKEAAPADLDAELLSDEYDAFIGAEDHRAHHDHKRTRQKGQSRFLPRRMMWLSLISAGLMAGFVGYSVSASGGSIVEILFSALISTVLGQLFPALFNAAVDLVAVLIQIAGEAVVLPLMSMARLGPTGLRRLVMVLVRGWDRLSYHLFQYLPYRLDRWIWYDKPRRS